VFVHSNAWAYKKVVCTVYVRLFAMASATGSLFLTISDLRSQVDTRWDQDIKLPIRYRAGPSLDVQLAEDAQLPMALFEYQLARAVYEGTALGGVKWWYHKRYESQAIERQQSFDLSVFFICKHYRKHYRKRTTNDSRQSKHQICSECPAGVCFKGSLATDVPFHAVLISATFKHFVSDPLKVLRKEFPLLDRCNSAEILCSNKFAFVFENNCLAEDALCVGGQQHALFVRHLKAKLQKKYIFSVAKLNIKHERHLRPSLPSHRSMFLSYAMNQEVAAMAANGLTPSAIINHLTRQGQHGMITRHHVDHIRATIETDIGAYAIRPSSRESACQATINMLAQRRRDKRDIEFIFLYTEPTENVQRLLAEGKEDDVRFNMIRMQTGDGNDGGISASDPDPQPTSWLSSLKNFFTDKWSSLSQVVVGPSREKKKILGYHMID
jgi:hypothetical protein